MLAGAMRIVAVEPILVEVPPREPVPVHGVHGTTVVQRSVLVRIETEAGDEGWGNVDPTPGYSPVSAEQVHSTVRALAPALLGADPFNLRAALARMDREVIEASEAKAAIEMALVDLKARALGLSVHALLGGRLKDAVTLNAWIGTVPGAGAPARRSRGVSAASAPRRSRSQAWLTRVSSGSLPSGRQSAAGCAAGGLQREPDRGSGHRVHPRLEPYALTLVEQPIPRDDIAGLARIRRAINIPLMADESVTDPAALVKIIRYEAADL